MNKKKINLQKKIRFYDDTGRGETYVMDRIGILWHNDTLCLCMSTQIKNDFNNDKEKGVILFNKITHEVLTNNLEFYHAENFK